jgi:transcriptional regulator with XRE-family HTH domain
MRYPRKTTTVVLVGAVGLASAAYGIGSQVGDGSASARDGANTSYGVADRDFHRDGPPGFAALADSLGVEAGALEKALRDFHDQQAGDHRDDFAKALAGALGIPADKVTEALNGLEDKHKQRFAQRLADELGVDAADVTAALDKLAGDRQDGPHGPGHLGQKLADELGVDVDKVEDALFAQRPDRGMHRGHHQRQPLRQLADALGVTRAELRKALREVRADAESGWQKRQEALVSFLADRFNLSEDKVKDALGDLPEPGGPFGPGSHHHRGGPGGPPGPGGPGGPPGPGGPGGPFGP